MMYTAFCVVSALMAASAADTARDVAQGVEETMSDAAITARIETMFMLNDHLSSFEIRTTTLDGVVTLTGGVDTQEQKELAESLARSLEATQNVVNNLRIMDQPLPPVPKRSWQQKIEDETTSASVRARILYNKDFAGLRIGVRTVNGIVTLSGVVDSAIQRDDIGKITFDTRGVEKVVNNLTVRSKELMKTPEAIGRDVSDEWIEKRVESAILFNRHMSIRQIDVEVNDGACILTGMADTQQEKDLAGEVAASIQGVASVINDLRIRTYTPPESVPVTPPKPAEAIQPAQEPLDQATPEEPHTPGIEELDSETIILPETPSEKTSAEVPAPQASPDAYSSTPKVTTVNLPTPPPSESTKDSPKTPKKKESAAKPATKSAEKATTKPKASTAPAPVNKPMLESKEEEVPLP